MQNNTAARELAGFVVKLLQGFSEAIEASQSSGIRRRTATIIRFGMTGAAVRGATLSGTVPVGVGHAHDCHRRCRFPQFPWTASPVLPAIVTPFGVIDSVAS